MSGCFGSIKSLLSLCPNFKVGMNAVLQLLVALKKFRIHAAFLKAFWASYFCVEGVQLGLSLFVGALRGLHGLFCSSQLGVQAFLLLSVAQYP